MKLIFYVFILNLSFISAEEFSLLLEKVRKKYDLPALAGAISLDGKVIEKGAVGVRKVGTDIKVTLKDKFHIGSCTKSMTATLAGRLVDLGKIKWETTLGELFPELEIHPSNKRATLEQLLSHTAGFPNISGEKNLWGKLVGKMELSSMDQRKFLLETMLKRKPAYERGTKYVYSNCSVTFAGMMLERVTGKTWESLVQNILVKALSLNSLGFGPQATFGEVDHPLGHVIYKGEVLSIPSSVYADNPAAIAPAGLVHLSVNDFIKYTLFQSQKCKGFLKPETFKKIITPVKDQYGLGWQILNRSWGNGKVMTHSGSNTSNYAIMWIAPNKEFSVVVMTNIVNEKVYLALDEVVSFSIMNYLQ